MFVVYQTFPPAAFRSIEHGLVVWSADDFSSTKSVSGIKTSRYPVFYVYDYMNSDDYIGLSFPYQHYETTYYTTQKKDTGEECIIVRTADKVGLILSKDGTIMYKKIYNNQLYYIFNNTIRRFDLKTGSDEEVINGIAPAYGFDINSVGDVLYTANFVMLLRLDDMTESAICLGKAAKFIDDSNIVYSYLDRICRMNIVTKDYSIIKSKVNCRYILLNPSRTHIIYINMTSSKDGGDMFMYEGLYIMLLNGKNHNAISGYPSFSYGLEWIDYLNN